MRVFTGSADLQKSLANDLRVSKSIGFVPTMGALHDGHLKLVKDALKACDRVVVSIFVNPRQFDNPNDLIRYPRNLEQDTSLLQRVGCHYLFTPDEMGVYANEADLEYDFGSLMKTLEGAFRPGHFEGMLSVVHQLLVIVQPHSLFMGEKDFQQAALVKRLIKAQHPMVHFHLTDTVREPDGLAMSSRNVLLSSENRMLAKLIPLALKKIVALPDLATCINALTPIAQELIASGIRVDYLQIRREDDLGEIQPNDGFDRHRVFFAGYVGVVRLIDNMALLF